MKYDEDSKNEAAPEKIVVENILVINEKNADGIKQASYWQV
jgi:hypothetical protein